MKYHSIILISLGIFAIACHKQAEELVVPRPTWKLRSDIFLINKILLGAHATDKRLIVAHTAGFFQMDAGDTSFIQYSNGGGGTLLSFGGFFSNSLYSPLLSNTLYAGLPNERNSIAITDVFGTRDSTDNYSDYNGGGFIYVPRETGIPNGQVSVFSGAAFGAYNESTKTLLYAVTNPQNQTVNTATRTVVMNKQEKSPYFAYRTDYSNVYRTDSAVQIGFTGSIAVKDYFIITPNESFLTGNVYLYAIDAKTGRTQKVPITISPPYTYFFYKSHLYGLCYNGDLVRSDDGGFSWRRLGYLGLDNFKFAVVNGSLIAYGLSQLFWIDEGAETFSNIRELTNEGLEFSQITGVVAFNNKVFATTLSGLYTIDAKDFFTVKQK